MSFKERLRVAVANYIGSEGCWCCEGDDHDDHGEELARLLDVPENKKNKKKRCSLLGTY